MRKDATKVWHNPEIETLPRRGERRAAADAADARAASESRAALEALFAPKKEAPPEAKRSIVAVTAADPADPRVAERQKLLARLLAAEGRTAVSRAANELVKAGFELPVDQEVCLQLLEHADEDRVLTAIQGLSALLEDEAPRRRAMLESRLRRIQEFADERATRDAADELRRRVAKLPIDS